MAFIAEVGVAPAEPLGYRAAEPAFEGDKLFTVLFAVSHLHWAAGRTNQFLGVKLLAF